jgi:hypothetical protein
MNMQYLGIYIDHHLDWSQHVEIMANRARSTIRGLSILGNSIRGLNFLNWRKVYNAIIIPSMTYGCPIWYMGKGQKSLIHCLQATQNKGIRRLMGVFRTTLMDILHNLTRILPIHYMLCKLTHSHTLHLQNLPGNARVWTTLSKDWCCYWPDYIQPMTILMPTYGHTNCHCC